MQLELSNKKLNIIRSIFPLFLCLLLFFIVLSYPATGQKNTPAPYPDRIILNLAEDAATSVAVTWRTDLSIREGFCELQPMTPTRINPANTRSFKANTTAVKYEYEGEPTIEANQHSYVFTNLVPGQKYLYRVGKEEFWSEWFEFSTPSVSDGQFSFVYFGDPQSNLKSELFARHIIQSPIVLLCFTGVISLIVREEMWNGMSGLWQVLIFMPLFRRF